MYRPLSRRSFIKKGVAAVAGSCIGCPMIVHAGRVTALEEARHYDKKDRNFVTCRLCFRSCTIATGKRGFCKNRENRAGTLYSLVYGKTAALQLDPIEKEPMYHNLPASTILCTGTAGCNFRCKFCHNWHLSQQTVEDLAPYTRNLTPDETVNTAIKRGAGLSFTYNEPTVFYEYMYDIAKIAHAKGLNTIFHTNGGMQQEPMKKLLAHMRGVTVDLKGFTADYYRDMSFAKMTPVLNTLKLIKEQGRWLEIVNLLVPTMNDNMKTIREMSAWIVDNLGPDVPLHFSRFYPAYKLKNLSPTPIKTLEQAHDIAVGKGIRFVYLGNVPGHRYNSTYCPACKKRIIHRTHFSVHKVDIKNGRCIFCRHPIPGLWAT